MRILHAIHSLSPESGGPAEGLRRIAHSAQSSGAFFPEAISLDAPGEPFLAEAPFPVHGLGPGLGHYGYTRRIDSWMERNLDRFDGVVVHGLWQYHGSAVRRACLHRNKPYVVFTHGMLDPWFRDAYPLKHLKKQLYWRAAEYSILRDASRVLFTAALEAELATQSFYPSAWRSAVVPYGTVPPAGDPKLQIGRWCTQCPQLQGRRFVLFLGRIHEKKGCDLLIEAFGSLAETDKELHLVIAGPDQQGRKSDLAALAARHGVSERVHFPGLLQGDAKWGAFRAAEVFVLPSHQENFGIAVAEALACGTPVLISNQVNIWREIVEDHVGFVDDDTVEGTTRLLRRWLDLSAAEQKAMAERAFDCFARRFDIRQAPLAIARIFARSDSGGQG